MKVEINPGIKNKIISGNDMQPLDFGIIRIPYTNSHGHLIMRTQSGIKKEWIDFSHSTASNNYIHSCSHEVELLPKGTIIKITI